MDARSSRALRQRLQSLADAGVTALPSAAAEGRRRPKGGGAEPSVKAQRKDAAAALPVAGSETDRTSALAIVKTEVESCTRCGELATARHRTVFGAGRADARLCFFGEAPGADEDASGEPFVGRAGQLLTKIIEACHLTRDDVYILNVLKCRPPGNRPPHPDEVSNCRGFFERQFSIIRPDFICCLGTSASQSLLQTSEPIGKLRGRWFTYGEAQVICTYHPSYLLRNPAAKRDVWDDMKRLMARMGVDV